MSLDKENEGWEMENEGSRLRRSLTLRAARCQALQDPSVLSEPWVPNPRPRL